MTDSGSLDLGMCEAGDFEKITKLTGVSSYSDFAAFLACFFMSAASNSRK